MRPFPLTHLLLYHQAAGDPGSALIRGERSLFKTWQSSFQQAQSFWGLELKVFIDISGLPGHSAKPLEKDPASGAIAQAGEGQACLQQN
jgi:hypothetical protein